MAEKLEQDGFSIPIAVITRWNSQYQTVVKTIEIPSEKLNDCLRELKKESLILSQRDLAILNEFISVFALFAEVFTRAQADQTSSISLVAPSLLQIYFDLELEQTTLKYGAGLCKTLLRSMEARFGGLLRQFGVIVDGIENSRSTSALYTDPIFLMAPFLDARFGLRWITHSKLSNEIKQKLCETIKRLVINAALQLHGSDLLEKADKTTDTLVVNVTSNASCSLKRKTLFAFPTNDDPSIKKARCDVLEEVEEEVLLFAKEVSNDSTLIFKKKRYYPHLSLLAYRLLCVPATTAPIERIFSTSGFLMRPHRGRLSREMLAILTHLKCNLDLLQ